MGGLLRGSTDNTFVSNKVTDFPPLSVWSPVQKRPDEVLADDLQFWFDSSDRSTIHNNATCTSEADSGDEVLCWQDKSNKGHDVASSSGAAPIFEFKGPNSLGNLKFDGSNDILSGSIVAFLVIRNI